MDNLGSKIQKGLDNVQKGIEDGKSKFQTSQEVGGLREEVRELEAKRTSLMLDLGELTYTRMRTSNGNEGLVESITGELLQIDKKIFNLLHTIEEKSFKESAGVCQCGNPLTPTDKFCKSCGNKVEVFEKNLNVETIICHKCNTENITTNNFCNCCGVKIK